MRLLIVEDDHKIANALKKGLEQASFAVDVVYDGDTGLSKAINGTYDAIILDRMLPGHVQGLDILKKMREQAIATPVLLLTAKDQVKDRVEGLNVGADDYLAKPFAFDELVARVRALLRRPDQKVSEVLRYRDLALNPQTFAVSRAGKKIELTSKEFALLEYLMRNAGQTLSKSQLTEHVWDFDADILPNTVEVYMGYLRKKIDKPFAGPELIHTSRGFGYRLGEPGGEAHV